jgi:hypothetical protein
VRRALAVAAVAGLALTGCGSTTSSTSPTTGTLPWDRPSNQATQVAAAGLTLSPHEELAVHYHAHLDVFVNGTRVPVPAGLGISVNAAGTAIDGIAALHTHDESGLIHIEAPQADDFTLGQVFTEWGVSFTDSHAGAYSPVKVYVNGKAYASDPTKLVLAAHQEIAAVIGTPPATVPSTYAFPAGS